MIRTRTEQDKIPNSVSNPKPDGYPVCAAATGEPLPVQPAARKQSTRVSHFFTRLERVKRQIALANPPGGGARTAPVCTCEVSGVNPAAVCCGARVCLAVCACLRFSRGGAKHAGNGKKCGEGEGRGIVFLVVVGAVFLFEVRLVGKKPGEPGDGQGGMGTVRRGKGGVVCVLLLDWAFLG